MLPSLYRRTRHYISSGVRCSLGATGRRGSLGEFFFFWFIPTQLGFFPMMTRMTQDIGTVVVRSRPLFVSLVALSPLHTRTRYNVIYCSVSFISLLIKNVYIHAIVGQVYNYSMAYYPLYLVDKCIWYVLGAEEILRSLSSSAKVHDSCSSSISKNYLSLS